MLKVGVVLPVYNAQEKIERTIDSILNQSASVDIKVCVIDDCSSDNSASVVQRCFGKNSSLKLLLNSSNRGVAFSRNLGINWMLNNFNFDFLAFCDSDDIWFKEKLELQLEDPAQFNYGGYIAYNWVKDQLGRRVRARVVQGYRDCLAGNPFPMSSIVLHRSLVIEDLFPSRFHEDYRAWLTMLSHDLNRSITFKSMPCPVFFYGEGEISITSNRLKSLLEFWQVLADFGVPFPLRLFYLFKSLFYKFNRLI